MRCRHWPVSTRRKSKVVELRFFGGLSVDETAAIVKVSPETVMRDWQFAKAWLRRTMRDAPAGRLTVSVLVRRVRAWRSARKPDCLFRHEARP